MLWVRCYEQIWSGNRNLKGVGKCGPKFHVEGDVADHVIAVTGDFQACIEDGTVSQIIRQCTLAATAALTLA